MPPIPSLPPAHLFSTQPVAPYPPAHLPIKDEVGMLGRPRGSRKHPAASSLEDEDDAATAMPHVEYRNPNPTGINIKTKFPVARIKRIMQADEEVGKVAQVTPVAVTRALELFMIALVTGAADKAREKGGKRVGAGHLKNVVESDKRWDFLEEIVGRVTEAEEKDDGEGKGKGSRGKRQKSESMSDDEVQVPRKKKGVRGRKSKVPE